MSNTEANILGALEGKVVYFQDQTPLFVPMPAAARHQ